MAWHVVSLNSRMEQETAQRISAAGFIAHCPVWVKKYRVRRTRGVFFETRVEPLFPCYIFVGINSGFRKDRFETSKVRLTVFHKSLVSEAQMTVINSTANELTAAQSRSKTAINIKRGDLMQLLHGAWNGEPVEVLAVSKNRITVQLKRFPASLPVDVTADRLERVA